jgi:hypothetical protein
MTDFNITSPADGFVFWVDLGVYIVALLLVYVCYDNGKDIIKSRDGSRIKASTLLCDSAISVLLIMYSIEHGLLPLLIAIIIFFLYNMTMLILKIKCSNKNESNFANSVSYSTVSQI